MITLNSDRGYEQVKSWDEIQELAGFTAELDPDEHELKEIIGNYLFKDFIACGLVACHQPHGAGFIVSTKSGKITNIGNVCGKKHFGVEFKQLSRQFDRNVTAYNNRINISAFVMRMPDFHEELQNLRTSKHGADWINKYIGSLIHHKGECPDSIVDRIQKMVRARNPDIEISRMATKPELEQIAIQQRKDVEELSQPQYIQELVGSLSGIAALYPENSLRELIVVSLQQKLDVLEKFDIDSAEHKELKYWAKWCSDFDYQYEYARSIVEEGKTLLQANNLEKLVALISDKEEIKQLRAFIRKTDQ